ncbi:MAG: OadG family protein [Bacteroidales bacterium]
MPTVFLFRILSLNPLAGADVPLDDAGEFAMKDPYGLLMALLGMGIVFAALLMMYLIFRNTPVLYTASFRARLRGLTSSRASVRPDPVAEQAAEVKAGDITGETGAAIAAAIHLYRSELHDFEDTVLTIKKVSRTYSPWSSKIYGLRNSLGRH